MPTDLTLIPIVDEGLGNSTYLLDLGDGRALVLDPERDLRQVRSEAQRRKLTIAYAVETHLHADFISGVRELADLEGATVLAPDVGPRGFAVTALADGDTIDLGRFTLRALFTPGHSPEHMSYLLNEGDQLRGVFTGGSLMVGTAGRTDLAGPGHTLPLARAQYHSLQRLMELPDETPVWPTHGVGSFCSSSIGGERVSTIGKERAANPLLQVDGEDAFVEALLGSLGTFPEYFLRLGEINHKGPAVLGSTPTLTSLTTADVEDLVDEGAQVVDVRPAAEFADGHILGALSITLRPVFATWLGWLADPNRPVVIIRSANQNSDDIVWEAAKVGFDTLAGELQGGMDGWNGPVDAGTVTLQSANQLAAQSLTSMLDIRQEGEFTAGHIAGAVHIELGALSKQLDQAPDGPVVVMCGHGERAMGAASILAKAGHSDVRVLDGCPADLAHATGRELQVGS
ncbi:MBL fold metallo-hydrolase [Hoyosella altamirensis]|uniref:Glyoxylase-like metal-dependent hydrolase (Beta-lactamase superfamily II)/rhodanese-related sulfurtransferase n=1 Tax=Hoyosella altamirensis TaxID=616997 RepID=A0A839RIA4_9ACTN|nr:MBL fold metallo-hydrolase [Hoyosella altamirensis]MBB3035924.1 glyoxylase-like metal-dependent hydrolase (beta-lactamase superfamily II)/rhodanese-related sulfurtransferase [Hoyosella altamirensis]